MASAHGEVLPVEPRVEITIRSDPSDALSLSKVCQALATECPTKVKSFFFVKVSRLFQAISADREVWILLLKSVCRQYGIFLPSYPIEDVALMKLQRAALTPHRWMRLIQRNLVSGEDPAVPSFLVWNAVRAAYRIKTGLKQDPDSESILFLIPGGRFLLSLNSSHRCIHLWDLGWRVAHRWRNPSNLRRLTFPLAHQSCPMLHAMLVKGG